MTQTIRANGLRFGYIEEGQGPLVLMMHGFPDTAHTWDDIRPQIAAKGYRAVSPFMRGYHPSEVPDRDTDGRTLGEDVLALIEALGEKTAILIGHDWGASAVYSATALDESRVEKLITVGIPHPAAIKPTLGLAWGVRHFAFYKLPGAPARFAKNDYAALPEIYKRWSPAWSPPDEEFAPVKESWSHPGSLDAAFGYYRALETTPPKYIRKKLSVPTVSFAGLDDPVLSPAHFHAAKRMFTGEYVVEEMRGGHFMHREHPEQFAELLLPHLP